LVLLDREFTVEMLELTWAAADPSGEIVVTVTHDPTAPSYADRVVIPRGRRIV
jgi:ABC-type lipoprotein export system ATPase subunit